MFGRKNCPHCDKNVKESFDFCPKCGKSLRTPEQEMDDFGLLGKSDEVAGAPGIGGGGFSITDKFVNSIFNSLMKSLEKQMRQSGSDAEIQNFPSGVTIRVGMPGAKTAKESRERKQSRIQKITQEQINRMTGLPRVEAPSSMKRLGDKIVYELKAAGINSLDDVFVSKLAEGYEIKAIGLKKVYVNSLPVELPLQGYTLHDKGLTLEFGAQ